MDIFCPFRVSQRKNHIVIAAEICYTIYICAIFRFCNAIMEEICPKKLTNEKTNFIRWECGGSCASPNHPHGNGEGSR